MVLRSPCFNARPLLEIRGLGRVGAQQIRMATLGIRRDLWASMLRSPDQLGVTAESQKR
jgi:hypothetical protein